MARSSLGGYVRRWTEQESPSGILIARSRESSLRLPHQEDQFSVCQTFCGIPPFSNGRPPAELFAPTDVAQSFGLTRYSTERTNVLDRDTLSDYQQQRLVERLGLQLRDRDTLSGYQQQRLLCVSCLLIENLCRCITRNKGKYSHDVGMLITFKLVLNQVCYHL